MATLARVALACGLALAGCKGGKGDANKAFADYSAAYAPAYQAYTHNGLSDVQQTIWAAGDAGKAMQPEYDALKKKGDEVEALLNDANKDASDGRAKGDASLIAKGTAKLTEAQKKNDALKPEIAALAAKATAVVAKAPPAAAPTAPAAPTP